MDKEQISVGKDYQCKSALLTENFFGTVIAVYENSCVMEVLSCAALDSQMALEYNNRFVVSFANILE